MKMTITEAKLNDIAEALATMKVNLPNYRGNSNGRIYQVKNLEITESMVLKAISGSNGIRSYTPPGMYTGLYINGRIWMSDTIAERLDHMWFITECMETGAEKVIVTGLGLGMVIQGLIRLVPSVKEILVIERSQEIWHGVGSEYIKRCIDAGVNLEIVLEDAKCTDRISSLYSGYNADAAWHDIWEDYPHDDDPERAYMRDMYHDFVKPGGFQMCWGDQNKLDPEGYQEMLDTMFAIMSAGIVIDQEQIQ